MDRGRRQAQDDHPVAALGQRPRPSLGEPARRPLRGGLGRAVVGPRRRARRGARRRRRARGGSGRAGREVPAVRGGAAAWGGDRGGGGAVASGGRRAEFVRVALAVLRGATASSREGSERWAGRLWLRGRRRWSASAVLARWRSSDERVSGFVPLWQQTRQASSALDEGGVCCAYRHKLPAHPHKRPRARGSGNAPGRRPRSDHRSLPSLDDAVLRRAAPQAPADDQARATPRRAPPDRRAR